MRNVCLSIILIFISCSISSNRKIPEINNDFEGKVREFKIAFFKDCISVSARDKSVREFIWEDISTTSDLGLGINNYDIIDSLVAAQVQKIQLDSILRTEQICRNCDEETIKRMKANGMIGKQIFGFCLDYFVSNELDSIARVSLR